jgi:hypothetical protein
LLGAVRGEHVGYVGGTIKAIPQGTEGRLSLDDEKVARFEYKGGSYSIPYGNVTSMEFGQKAGRRIGLAVLVSPAFLFSEKKRHFLTLGFTNESGGNEAAVFELAKGVFQALLPSLEARTGKRAEIDLAYSGDDAHWNPSHSSEVRHGISEEAAVAPELRLYSVSVTSNPPGALITVDRMGSGKTPAVVKLQPGTYRLSLNLDGYKAYSQDITVEVGKPPVVEVSLTPRQ